MFTRATEARNFCEQHLLTESFGREDYRELCELVIKYLGGHVIRPVRRGVGVIQGPDDFVMRAPGALHHARLFASALYILKMAMLTHVIPQGLLTPNMAVLIDRIAQYIALVSWAVVSPSPSSSSSTSFGSTTVE